MCDAPFLPIHQLHSTTADLTLPNHTLFNPECTSSWLCSVSYTSTSLLCIESMNPRVYSSNRERMNCSFKPRSLLLIALPLSRSLLTTSLCSASCVSNLAVLCTVLIASIQIVKRGWQLWFACDIVMLDLALSACSGPGPGLLPGLLPGPRTWGAAARASRRLQVSDIRGRWQALAGWAGGGHAACHRPEGRLALGLVVVRVGPSHCGPCSGWG